MNRPTLSSAPRLPPGPHPASPYSWKSIFAIILQHRRTLCFAQLIAIAAALTSVPVPMLMPFLVDEVLLQQPGVKEG